MADEFAVTFDLIRQDIGYLRGYGIHISDWSDNEDKSEIVEMVIRKGLHMFYEAYEWSFLAPQKPLTIPSGVDELLLPSEFGHFTDAIYYVGSNNQLLERIRPENDGKVMDARTANPDTTGIPKLFALLPVAPTGQHGSRQKLIFWPTSDAAYTIQCRYKVTGEALTTEHPHPYGGNMHGTTILHACRAASEQQDGIIGAETQLFQMNLAKSMENDRKVKARTMSGSAKPRYYGREWPYVGVSQVTYDP